MTEWNARRLYETFFEIVRIPSPSMEEGQMMDYLVKTFQSLGFHTTLESNEHLSAFQTGNLICTMNEEHYHLTDDEAIFFSTHVDTVGHKKPITVVEDEAYFYSDGTTILGADPKMAIACMIECAHLLNASGKKIRPVEFIFTVGEELGSFGVQQLQTNLLQSESGYVLDHIGPVGTIVHKCTNQLTLAMILQDKVGQHASTTMKAFIQLVKKNKRTNEQMITVRQLETTIKKANQHIHCIIDIFDESAGRLDRTKHHLQQQLNEYKESIQANIAFTYTNQVSGYDVDESDDLVKRVMVSMNQLQLQAKLRQTNYRTDTNYFHQHNLKAINLGVAYEHIHQTNERVSKLAFIQLTKLLVTLSLADT